MKSISENLFCRGKRKTYYVRKRIPQALLRAYPIGKFEIVRSLQTGDKAEAGKRLRAELVRIDAEFDLKLQEMQKQRELYHLRSVPYSDARIQEIAGFWVRQVLLNDKNNRVQGMDDEDFDEFVNSIAEQCQELRNILARGQVERILPAMNGFIHLCGLRIEMTAAEERNAGYVFLEAVVTALNYQEERNQGKLINTDLVAPASAVSFGKESENGASWEDVFGSWENYVNDRPKSTVIASRTPWRQLIAFAAQRDIKSPEQLTLQHLSELVAQMGTAGLAIKTINGRLGKLREIFRIAVGKGLITANPAANTLGFKESARERGQKRRLSFAVNELEIIFGSTVFTENVRSQGQSGEASYWIPLIMFYTGARPEEIAGLLLEDIRPHPTVGWHFHITDLMDYEDLDLFDDDETKPRDDMPKKRRLKNHVSRRNIPIAEELVALGLLRYIEWLRTKGATALFPNLQRDSHDKLSGSFSKWFGRYKQDLGFTSKKKVLYSLRHNMKDFLEAAAVPTKYLKRTLGHASGDGSITDGYGSDVPIEIVAEHFAKVKFPAIPAQPWKPGKTFWKKARQ